MAKQISRMPDQIHAAATMIDSHWETSNMLSAAEKATLQSSIPPISIFIPILDLVTRDPIVDFYWGFPQIYDWISVCFIDQQFIYLIVVVLLWKSSLNHTKYLSLRLLRSWWDLVKVSILKFNQIWHNLVIS